MAEFVRSKDLPEKIAQEKEHKEKQTMLANFRDAQGVFDEKSFDDLTAEEKDYLLKVIAMRLGVVRG